MANPGDTEATAEETVDAAVSGSNYEVIRQRLDPTHEQTGRLPSDPRPESAFPLAWLTAHHHFPPIHAGRADRARRIKAATAVLRS